MSQQPDVPTAGLQIGTNYSFEMHFLFSGRFVKNSFRSDTLLFDFLHIILQAGSAVLRQGLPVHTSVPVALWLCDHLVMRSKRAEVSGPIGRPRRKFVCQQNQLLFFSNYI